MSEISCGRRCPAAPAFLLALALLPEASSTLFAHYHILLPASPAVRPGEPVALELSYGHPFEHSLEALKPPISAKVYPPGAAEGVDLLRDRAAGEKEAEKKEHRLLCPVDKRGDHIVVVEAAPIFDASERVITRDHVKVIVHARSQDGWDRRVGQPLELVPLVRPYGLRPGWVFQAAAFLDGEPLAGAEVEVERYNAEPAPSGPGAAALPEEEFITRTSRTAAGGIVTVTLDEAGWWGITVITRRGSAPGPDGTVRPVVLRSTLWVHVGEPLAAPRKTGVEGGR